MIDSYKKPVMNLSQMQFYLRPHNKNRSEYDQKMPQLQTTNLSNETVRKRRHGTMLVKQPTLGRWQDQESIQSCTTLYQGHRIGK